jgi:hypothetical protein
MFLYFIQRKGWLDNNPRFLASQLLHPHHRDLFRAWLQPLFFRALNLAPDDRSQPLRFRHIPYLNGGLFAATTLEQRYPALNLPDEPLRDLIRNLFERYRFVESEQAGDHDAVDPRMLGHVFERLMNDDDWDFGPNIRARAAHVLATEDLPEYPEEMKETFKKLMFEHGIDASKFLPAGE